MKIVTIDKIYTILFRMKTLEPELVFDDLVVLLLVLVVVLLVVDTPLVLVVDALVVLVVDAVVLAVDDAVVLVAAAVVLVAAAVVLVLVEFDDDDVDTLLIQLESDV